MLVLHLHNVGLTSIYQTSNILVTNWEIHWFIKYYEGARSVGALYLRIEAAARQSQWIIVFCLRSGVRFKRFCFFVQVCPFSRSNSSISFTQAKWNWLAACIQRSIDKACINIELFTEALFHFLSESDTKWNFISDLSIASPME